MLLGFDPVADFSAGSPVRGKHTLAVTYEEEETNIAHAHQVWPEIRDKGWRAATLEGWILRVPWYRTIDYDVGGIMDNLVFKYPGWRAREGRSQQALGVPGGSDDPLRGR